MSAKPITHTLAMLQGGAFSQQAGDKFAEMLRGVDETGKPGKLTITLDVKKAGGAVAVLAKVTDKTPEEIADADLFWTTVDGNLSVQNPAQRQLDLQQVPQQRRQMPEERIDPDTGVVTSAN